MDATIRPATDADAGAIADIYRPVVEDTHFSFETTPPPTSEMARRVRETSDRLPWLVCDVDGAVAGFAYASPLKDRPGYRWSVDVSVYVAETWRRQGVARGLYESLFALLRLQGVCTALAVIALPNPASVEFHESLGFERTGTYHEVGYKHGAWRDVGHWQRSLRERETPPSAPTHVDELRGTDPYADVIATGVPSIRL